MKRTLLKTMLAATFVIGALTIANSLVPSNTYAFGDNSGQSSSNGDSLLPSGSSDETACVEVSFGCARWLDPLRGN